MVEEKNKAVGRQLSLRNFFKKILICTSLISSSCTDGSKKIDEEIKANLLQGITEIKKTNDQKVFKDIISFSDFDKACIVLPYSDKKTVNKDLGFVHTTSIGGDDNNWGLIFVKDNQVIAEVELDRRDIDIPVDLKEKCISKNSTIAVEKNGDIKFNEL